MAGNWQEMQSHVLHGNTEATRAAVARALAEEVSAERILQQGLIPAMEEVGRRYERGAFFVPEMLVAARAMKAALADLRQLLVGDAVRPVARVAMGTVKGDLHDIGKNLVGMMLEGAGFEVEDLGTDVSPEQFVTAAENGAEIVGMSALLTTTMPVMARTIEALEAAGVRPQVKVIVGGAPVTEAYAQSIGADGFAPDASQVATLARRLVAVGPPGANRSSSAWI